MELLFILLEKRGELVTREELADRLWGTTVFVDTDQSINTAVRKVRMVLRDDPDEPRFIETVAGKGYRFAAPVTYNGEFSKSTPSAEQTLVEPFVQTPATSARKLTTAQFAATAAKDSGVQKAKQILDDRATAAIPLGYGAVARKTKAVLIAVLVLGVATTAWWLNRNRVHRSTARPPIRSVAVLPLKNLSGDPSQEYLADSMTEELIGRLSGIRDLRVISRTSVMGFKDTKLSVPEIAKTLGVDAILEGSVVRDGNRIRVHAQLIRAASDEHFWSEEYDRDLKDVLALQSDIAQVVAEKVQITVTGKERDRLVAARAVSPEAYDSYLKGKFISDYRTNTRADVEQSMRYFQEAIQKDPSFALPYVELGYAYDDLASTMFGGNPLEMHSNAVRAAQKALELDPDLADAHLLLADVRQKQYQWAEAEAEYKRAIELQPNTPEPHFEYALVLALQGRTDEAMAQFQRAGELNPPVGKEIGSGSFLFILHRYDEALSAYRILLDLRKDEAGALSGMGTILLAKHQPEQAIPVLEKGLSVSDRSPGIEGTLVMAYAQAGRRSDALRLLAELKKDEQPGYSGAFVIAYLGLGDYDQAFVWLERAYQEQANIVQLLKVHPIFDPIRGDPRFTDLLRRVGLD